MNEIFKDLRVIMAVGTHTIDLKHLGMKDLEQVGGKNASLGEMISHLSCAGVSVPTGFATTADSFREFLANDGLDKKIYDLVGALDTDDLRQLVKVGKTIRELIVNAPFSADFEKEI